MIVVSSSPETRTSQLVATRFPHVVFRQHPTRLLPHAARNVGAALARGRLLAFTDPDCRPRTDWLEVLVQASAAGWSVVQGAVDLQGHGWVERGTHLCKRFALLPGLRPYPLWVVSSVNVAYSRAAWEAAGPLDGELFCGDALLGWRAAAHGHRALFEPRAVVTDSHGGRFGGLMTERYTRGGEFAAVRAAYERWPRWRAVGYALASPALLGIVMLRAARAALAAGWGWEFVSTLPVQLAGQLAWIAGESRQYAARALRRSDLRPAVDGLRRNEG